MKCKTSDSGAQSVEGIVDEFVVLATMLDRVNAIMRWRWARDLAFLLEAEADDNARTATSKQIGEQIAIRLGRSAPYSGSWVRMHAAAYRRFPQEPGDEQTRRSFLAAVNGNASRSAKTTSGAKTQTPDPMGKILAAIRMAIEAGITADAILATVQKELSG